MKKLLFSLLGLVTLVLFNACNDNETAFEADADALIFTRSLEDQTQFGVGYYVYANKSMQNVTVITPSGQEAELESDVNYTSTFFKKPSGDDYSSTPPSPGEYEFDILTGENEEVIASDYLESNYVLPVNIESYELADNLLEIEWSEQENADAYRVRIIKITDGDENVYFSSSLGTGTEFILNTIGNMNYQGTPPQAGEDYTIEVMAYSFETDAVGDLFNIQSISSERRTITWD